MLPNQSVQEKQTKKFCSGDPPEREITHLRDKSTPAAKGWYSLKLKLADSVVVSVACHPKISCLLSHKCGSGTCQPSADNLTLAFGTKLQQSLRPFGIEILVDPMRPGDDLTTRMQTFDFDSLLFLLSEESLKSEPCTIERETAQRRGRPIFIAVQSGKLPDEYRNRLCLKVAELDTPAGVGKLANAIHEHVLIRQHLQSLKTESSPSDVTRKLARELYERDSSVLAEHIGELESIYRQNTDDYTRHWIACAIEHTGARDALAVLERLEVLENAPYPAEGIRRAIAKLNNVVNGGHHGSQPSR